MTQPIESGSAVVAAISKQLGEEVSVTTEQIASVLTTWNAIIQGDPPGTVRSDPDTGAVAHRIVKDGVHQWHVTAADGGSWFDMQPSMPGWTVLFSPETTTVEPSDS